MPASVTRILFAVFIAWGLACAIKALIALRKDETYVFGAWDGGALRYGKRLTRRGTQVKVVTGFAMALACLIGLVIPLSNAAMIVLVAVPVASVVCDLVFTDRTAS